MNLLALLLGLFGVPAVLLWLGHHLRRSTPRERRVFWGGMAGWGAGVILMVAAATAPPVLWEPGLRQLAVYWFLLAGGVLGMAVGALRSPS